MDSHLSPSTVASATVALESTLLLHGVPRDSALKVAARLFEIISSEGAEPRLITVQAGIPHTSTTLQELERMLALPPSETRKLNASNLGAAMWRKDTGATTVSSTMELAAKSGIRWFATGGLGGVHPFSEQGGKITFDISSDLFAFTRFPVAVVASGVKSILDVAATREALETLGVPVVGFRTDEFPAFYFRRADSGQSLPVDVRFDDYRELASFVSAELDRTGRGLLIVNPIAADAELKRPEWESWLFEAQADASVRGAQGRAKTPALLAALHRISAGATLKANLRLIEDNVRLAARLAITG